jgi:type I restriction enzyme S subunit
MESLRPKFDRYEAEGTVFGSINKKGFETMAMVNAPTGLVSAFEQFAFGLEERIQHNEQQTATLIVLRDSLLPKLISGEVRCHGVLQ